MRQMAYGGGVGEEQDSCLRRFNFRVYGCSLEKLVGA